VYCCLLWVSSWVPGTIDDVLFSPRNRMNSPDLGRGGACVRNNPVPEFLLGPLFHFTMVGFRWVKFNLPVLHSSKKVRLRCFRLAFNFSFCHLPFIMCGEHPLFLMIGVLSLLSGLFLPFRFLPLPEFFPVISRFIPRFSVIFV